MRDAHFIGFGTGDVLEPDPLWNGIPPHGKCVRFEGSPLESLTGIGPQINDRGVQSAKNTIYTDGKRFTRRYTDPQIAIIISRHRSIGIRPAIQLDVMPQNQAASGAHCPKMGLMCNMRILKGVYFPVEIRARLRMNGIILRDNQKIAWPLNAVRRHGIPQKISLRSGHDQRSLFRLGHAFWNSASKDLAKYRGSRLRS